MSKFCSCGRRGQVTTEFLVAFGLVVIPATVAGGYFMKADWEKTKCTYQTFQSARQSLIRTRAPTTETRTCGGEREQLTLLPLEALDRDSGGLDLQDLKSAVSGLWGRFSSLASRLPELPSSASVTKSASDFIDKSSSTATADPP